MYILFTIGGIIGILVSFGHGFLLQKTLVSKLTPEIKERQREFGPVMHKLFGPMMHFSTIYWFAGGLMMICLRYIPNPSVQLALIAVVSSFYLFGMIGNFIATRGKHFGWLMLAVSLGCLLTGAWILHSSMAI